MENTKNKNTNIELNRRSLLKGAIALAGASLIPDISKAAEKPAIVQALPNHRRKLGGTLEVSAIGLGVQNMSRTYQTTIPSRPEMINIIRKHMIRG